ncbi:MAG: hypothetical protein RLZZ15_4162 [Verrucomicrobiota bacterium]|jgi:tetratricopeptide (TPR) repeat protein
MRLRSLAAFASFAFAALTTSAADPLDNAIALYTAKRYPEARVALEKITAADPRNAAACYYLGMTLRARADTAALDDALPWLEKAATLAPANATYLADFGGTSLQYASKHTSLSAATKGRDAMERALKLDPADLDTHQGLFEFYVQAPWPLGNSAKATAHLDEIRRRDPARATALSVRLKTDAKDFAAAFKLCEDLLAKNPDDYIALYQYGRTAAISGQNIPRALAGLQRALTLPPPSPAAPAPSNIWNRIGNLHEKLAHPAEARAAYETALKLDPANHQAATALTRLK